MINPRSQLFWKTWKESLKAQMAKRAQQAKGAATAPARTTHGGLEDKDRIFQNLYNDHGPDLQAALKRGDWYRTKDILQSNPLWVVDQVKRSGLRGRGGAGFPSGFKYWLMAVAAKKPDRPAIVCINADESEPGTCKDREILRHEPHKLIEGTLMVTHAVGARVAYIYVRGEFYNEILALEKALAEAYKAGYLGQNIFGIKGLNIDIFVHRGAGAYICGEETGLIESLEGKPGRPRLKPPFPAQVGLYGCPTLVTNVETVSVIPSICRRGPDWFAGFGRDRNAGVKLFNISGDVNSPCTVEEEMSIPLKELIERHAGGVIGGWDNLMCVVPGGSSVPYVLPDACKDVLMDYDSLRDAGSALGTAGVYVINKNNDILRLAQRTSEFYMNESCGQCTPCREGTKYTVRKVKQIAQGKYRETNLRNFWRKLEAMEYRTICALGPAAAWPVQSLMTNFGEEIKQRIEDGFDLANWLYPPEHHQYDWRYSPRSYGTPQEEEFYLFQDADFRAELVYGYEELYDKTKHWATGDWPDPDPNRYVPSWEYPIGWINTHL